jgi:hypothetical protein
MSAYFKGRITALLLTVTSVWAAVPLASAASAVQLTYSLDRTGLTVNEPVLLKVVAENGTAEGVTIDLGTDFYGNFHAKLARPDGRMEIVPKPHEVLWQVGFPGAIALAAHGKVEKVLLLNRWFRFDMAGRYFLELELPEAPDSLAGSAPQVASRGEIVIDVGVRDPERLMDVCAKLEKEVMTSAPSPPGEVSPAEILAYIEDPITVPYLVELLGKKPHLDPLLAEGLGRIGDGPAVEALISSYLNSAFEYAKPTVRAVLAGVEDRTSDSQIKERIRAALK